MTPDRFEKPNSITAGTNPTETNQPHVTNEPFDKTSIEEAIINEDLPLSVDTGQLHAVANETYQYPREAAEEVFPDTTETTNANTSNTARNLGIAAAGLTLAVGAAVGITAANNQSTNTDPNTKPSATSTPVAGETQGSVETKPAESPLATPTNLGPLETVKPTTAPETKKPTTEVMPATLEQYKAMTAEQFAALSKSEQLTYWSWQSRKLDDFAKEWYATTLDPRDKLVAASETNTAQEIAAIQGFKIRFIFSIEDDLEREKALTAVLYKGRGSDSYPFWKDILKQIPSDMLNIELLAKNVTASASVIPVGPKSIENGVTIQDYTHTDGSHPTRNFYVPYTDARTGIQNATWIRQ